MQKKKVKAQASSQFLTTYGWAILLALTLVGVLAYLGLLNPNLVVPESCKLQLGMSCKDYEIDTGSNQVIIRLQNSMKENIIITGANFIGRGMFNCRADFSYKPFSEIVGNRTGLRMPQDSEREFIVHCQDVEPLNAKRIVDIELEWVHDDAIEVFTKTMRGRMYAGEKDGEEHCCCDLSNFGSEFDSWASTKECAGKIGSSCSTNNFHDCRMLQQKCCYISNTFIWGDETCFGRPDTAVSADQCEY